MGWLEDFLALFGLVAKEPEEGKPPAQVEAPTIDRTAEVTEEPPEPALKRTEVIEPPPPVEPIDRPPESPKEVATDTEKVGTGETITKPTTEEEAKKELIRRHMM